MSERRGFPIPHVEGTASRQAHADLPAGSYEREIGRDGFYGPATHMYHAHPPTGWTSFEGPLRPRAFDANALSGEAPCPFAAPLLLGNPRLALRLWRTSGAMPALARNADGDELLFVHAGRGELFCDYGHLSFRDGDYMLLPRGTLWRIEAAEPVVALLIEATGGGYRLPDRGPLGEHAIYDPGVLEVPHLDDAFRAQQSGPGGPDGEHEWTVRVKARGRISTLGYPWNPLDALGWKGTLCALRLNWRDIRPVSSARYHLPPSAHTTFAAPGFVVCTFCPRPLESDPGALKLPFFHSNDDYDEVIFYHRGRFMSRDEIRPGMLTLHPCGFTHGPHPKALEQSQRAPRSETDEVAVMLDARDALEVAPAARGVEWPGYVDSWRA